jgi:hypothetical protein
MSKRKNFIPLFLINCDYQELKDELIGKTKNYKWQLDNYIEYLNNKKIPLIEIKKLFTNEIKKKKISPIQLYSRGTQGHYSYMATLVIAQKLSGLFKNLQNLHINTGSEEGADFNIGPGSPVKALIDKAVNKDPDYKYINKKIKEHNSLNKKFDSESPQNIPDSRYMQARKSFYNQNDLSIYKSSFKTFLGSPVNSNYGNDKISPQRAQSIEKAGLFLNLARNHLDNHNIKAALENYKKTLAIIPEWVEVMNEYAWVLATASYDFDYPFKEAVQYAGLACEAARNENPLYMDTLAACYARAGNYRDAAGIAFIALKLAQLQNRPDLARAVKKRKELYESGNFYKGPRH